MTKVSANWHSSSSLDPLRKMDPVRRAFLSPSELDQLSNAIEKERATERVRSLTMADADTSKESLLSSVFEQSSGSVCLSTRLIHFLSGLRALARIRWYWHLVLPFLVCAFACLVRVDGGNDDPKFCSTSARLFTSWFLLIGLCCCQAI